MNNISIIIPVYNVEKYIHRCIDSVLAQTITNFELILVDDGSTDASGKICDEYEKNDDRIKVFHQDNQGQSKARNVALDYVFERGQTDWIAFIDSDDWVHPRYLELLLDAVNTYKVLISNVFLTHVHLEETPENKNGFSSTVERMEDVYISFGKEVACYPQGRLYEASLWKDIRFPVGKIWEDVATLYKVFLQVKEVAFVHGELYYYFVHSESTSNRRWNPRFFEEIDAYEQQLADKRIYNNSIICPRLREQYIYRVYRQLHDMRKTDLTKRERKEYEKALLKILRHVLRKYSRDTKYDFNRKNYYLYEIAYPVEMKYYWHWQGIKQKFRKRKK